MNLKLSSEVLANREYPCPKSSRFVINSIRLLMWVNLGWDLSPVSSCSDTRRYSRTGISWLLIRIDFSV